MTINKLISEVELNHEININIAINEVAKDLHINVFLCKALCRVISNYNPYYCTFDAKLHQLLSNSNNSVKVFSPHGVESEIIGRSCNWGLFGVSGQYAREQNNVTSSFLSVLVDIELNIAIGLKYLKDLLDRYEMTHGLEGVVSAYQLGKPKFYQGVNEYKNTDFIHRVMNKMKYLESHQQPHDTFNENIKDKSKAKPTIRRKLDNTSTANSISSMIK